VLSAERIPLAINTVIRNGAVTQKPANPTERRKEGEKGYLAKLVSNE